VSQQRERILLTGATSGIGRAAAFELAQQGSHLILPVRNMLKGEQLAQELEKRGGTTELYFCELSSMLSVYELAQKLLKQKEPIDTLINNAGLFCSARVVTEEGFEQTLAVNHLAPFLLTTELLPLLDHPNGRVINVASRAHRYGRINLQDPFFQSWYIPPVVYGSSKLANILFTHQLSTLLQHARTYSFHPGVVKTNIAAEAGGVFGLFFSWFHSFLLSPEEGAAPIFYLLKRDLQESSGSYFNRTELTLPSRAARDPQLAEELWRWSQELLARLKLPGQVEKG
jgi:retinol dehydrogenase 12